MTGFSTTGGASGFAGIGPDGQSDGDLTGSFPNPLVRGLWDQPIDPRLPENGDTLVYNGGEWIPTPTPANTAALFKGVWDANTNTPNIANYPGLSDGFTWLVQVAGETNIGGIIGWKVGDYVIYSGGNWYKLSNSSFGWGLTGNAGTVPNVNYVGTSDNKDFSIRANATEGFRIFATGGTRATGDLEIIGALNVSSNITGSNAKFSGKVAVDGGCISTAAATFSLVNTTATTVNFAGNASALSVGNALGTNTISGVARFLQGMSGSLTRLTDGASAFVGDVGVLVSSASNGAVTLKVDDSKFASLTGSVFSGRASFSGGLSGSLTKLTDGTSYLIAGNNMTVSSASNGPVSISFSVGGSANNNDFLTYNGTTWVATSQVQASSTGYQAVLASEAIAAGDVCYIVNSGGSGAVPTVARAQANSLATIHGVVGLATGSIPKNTQGAVQTYGQLVGPVDTHLFGQGDPLYVSAVTPGALTNVKPTGPNYTFQVGVVTRQGQPQNVTSGIVFISPMLQTDTQNVSDLVFTTPTTHDGMMYDPATSTWKNVQPLWVPETQTDLTLANGATITAANFANVVYLPIKTAGGANITLNATAPIAALTKTAADYGRELWLFNNDNNRSVTIPAGGTVKLEGGVNLTLLPSTMVKFVWTGLGGNGAWVQTDKAITVG